MVPETDLSSVTPEDRLNWQEGVKYIAETFAQPEIWTRLAEAALKFYSCGDGFTLAPLILQILASFGPRPYLLRVEELVMSLLKPVMEGDASNDQAAQFGVTVAIRLVQLIGRCSRNWPREARLQLFGRVLPRLMLYTEAAAQLISIKSAVEYKAGVSMVAARHVDVIGKCLTYYYVNNNTNVHVFASTYI